MIRPQLNIPLDKPLLSEHIDYDADKHMVEAGKVTVIDRYLIEGETSPQHAYMRCASAFATDKQHALRMYSYMKRQWFGPASPVLANAPVRIKFFEDFERNFSHEAFVSVYGPLPISCYTGYVPDSRVGIADHYQEMLWIASNGGGYASDWSPLRQGGAVTSTGGVSGGLVPFFHVTDSLVTAAHQGSNRRAVYGGNIRCDHPEVIEFIESRKMSGDPNKRSRNVFQALKCSDKFMYAVLQGKPWDLVDNKGKVVETIQARDLWELAMELMFETGGPFIVFEDTCKRMLPEEQKELGLDFNNVNICCMASDQRVVTDLGLVTVAELYASQYAPKLAGRGVISQGTPMLLPRPNAPMVKVLTAEGYSHKVTPDHRIWVVGKGWVEAQDIQPNDKIELQTQSLFGTESNEALAFIAGLIAGDGTYSDDSANVRIDLWKGKTDHLVSEVEQLVHSVLANQAINTSVPLPATNTPVFKDCGDKYALNSRQLAALLAVHGFTRDTKLKVPEFVFKGTKETIEQYIRGLLLTDGTVQATNKGAATVSLASVNKPLLEDVQLLLINLGITSRIKLMRKACVKDMPNGKGGLAPYQCADVYRLLITSTQMAKAINSFTAIGEARNNQEFLALISKETFRVKPKYQATFIGLEVLPNEDAYCLTVDSEDHAWTVQGMITHNTEITLANNEERTAVCCLSSYNMLKHDEWKDNEQFIFDCVEFLDNVLEYFIQNALYSCTKDFDWSGLHEVLKDFVAEDQLDDAMKTLVEKRFMGLRKAVHSAKSERAIGLGSMGWDSYFKTKMLPYESTEALDITYTVTKWVKETAVKASYHLGAQRGHAPDMFRSKRRNSHVLADAPTATNSLICGGVTPSREPRFQNIYPQQCTSATFQMVEPELAKVLDKYNKNTYEVRKSIEDMDGSVQHLDFLDDLEKKVFRTAYEVDQLWIVEHVAAAQQFVCQAISTNLFFRPDVPRKYVNAVHFQMWKKGCKSRYYIRSKALATSNALAKKVDSSIMTIDYNRADIFQVCLSCEG